LEIGTGVSQVFRLVILGESLQSQQPRFFWFNSAFFFSVSFNLWPPVLESLPAIKNNLDLVDRASIVQYVKTRLRVCV
jgi:hypothetical protein